MTTRTRHDAIAYAARTVAALRGHADSVDGARAVTLDEAREVAPEGAGLVWCGAPAPKRLVCRPGQDVYDLAREHFGAEATVCVTQDAGDRPVLGRVAAQWSGPFFDVVACTAAVLPSTPCPPLLDRHGAEPEAFPEAAQGRDPLCRDAV